MPDLSLTIDRLILEGLPLAPGEERLLRAALETELARLLAEGGLPAAWQAGGAVPSLSAPALDAIGGTAELGRAVARSVYSSLGGDPARGGNPAWGGNAAPGRNSVGDQHE